MFDSNNCSLFDQGTDYESYRWLGAHPCCIEGQQGSTFTLWAPHAQWVGIICAKTGWENEIEMKRCEGGVWETFLPDVGEGDAYRLVIVGADGIKRYKSDPYAFRTELRPHNASIVCSLDNYHWHDNDYQAAREGAQVLENPMAIYEVHLGSWKKRYDNNASPDGFLNYREYADQLSEYVRYMGYTHVELMGICEYPFDGSWGYQVTGFFSPTSRYGTPDDFRYFVDTLHQAGIGVILDWVPAHFPKDSFGLERFDGTPLFEPDDPLRAEFPVWGTYAFDHAKPQVRSFLISSAFYWVKEFHIDALRVDAVAAMTYLDYDRSEWRPNAFGGRINLESQDFLRQLNNALCTKTTAYLIAEDSSIEWGITESVDTGGLGFKLKWNMGWMNDTLRYIGKDPIYRKYHHEELVHTIDYAFTEHFVLVLSHDEVVHLKRSIVEKTPGSLAEKLGCIKVLYTHQIGHPGKKLLFMGQDFAQHSEWSEAREIDWHLADDAGHRDVMETLRRLLAIYRSHPVLYADSHNPASFEWVNRNDAPRNVISYIRRNPWNWEDAVLVVCNFSPMHIADYACGVPIKGRYQRIFSTYDTLDEANEADKDAENNEYLTLEVCAGPCDGHHFRLSYALRPYEAIIVEFPRASSNKGKQSHTSPNTSHERARTP